MTTALSQQAKPARRLTFGNRRGQAMTEALLMMSLLGFAWMVASWMTFLGENRVRISASARHKVWELAHDITPPADSMVSFYNSAGLSESSNDNQHDVPTPPVNPPSQMIDFSSLLTLKPNMFRVHEKEVIINILPGSTDKFFDKTLRKDLPLLGEKKYEPTVIGAPNAAWADMQEYLNDRDEIMNWIRSGS